VEKRVIWWRKGFSRVAAELKMMPRTGAPRIIAIDCCEHVFGALKRVSRSGVLSVGSKEASVFSKTSEVHLIAIGMARYPVRRLFISQLRTIYPNVPMLILRREQIGVGESQESIRAEFILGDQSNDDYEIVRSLRKVMPFPACACLLKGEDYETVDELVSMLRAGYADPKLDLAKVAKKLTVSPKRLSVILNKHVGISFRELLRQTRIEEAKRMLRAREHSVKEVAARVGFTDSHYFSRSFKEFTGQNASEYQEKSAILT
jgi:AraC-like DNA-binding protein